MNKEFEYYSKIDQDLAVLVPLVQDLEFWLEKHEEEKSDNSKIKYKESLLRYMEMIPKLKNEDIMYQPYVPVEVFKAVAGLIGHMQDNIKELAFYGEIIFGQKDGSIDFQKLKTFVEEELKLIALIEAYINTRLTELSEN